MKDEEETKKKEELKMQKAEERLGFGPGLEFCGRNCMIAKRMPFFSAFQTPDFIFQSFPSCTGWLGVVMVIMGRRNVKAN